MRTLVTSALIASTTWSGCALVPNRNSIMLNHTIDLDARPLDGASVSMRLEWIR